MSRHEIVDTVDRTNFWRRFHVIGHAGPFPAIAWSKSRSRRKLPSLSDMGHAMALEQVEIGPRVNRHVDRRLLRVDVCGFVRTFGMVGFVAGTTA